MRGRGERQKYWGTKGNLDGLRDISESDAKIKINNGIFEKRCKEMQRSGVRDRLMHTNTNTYACTYALTHVHARIHTRA